MAAVNNNRTARLLVVAALITTAVGSLVVLITPARQYSTTATVVPMQGMPTQAPPPVTEQLIWFGVLREVGPGYLVYLAIPLIICLAGVLALRLKDGGSRGRLLYLLGLTLFVLAFMAIMSIGIFYFLAAVLLLAAAVASAQESRRIT